MQRVEIIILPFATKRLPRYLNLSKPAIVMLFFSLLSILVLAAYLLLAEATYFYHEWQFVNINNDHRILLDKLISVKEKIIQADQTLSFKDQNLNNISLITETKSDISKLSSVLTRKFFPWDEKGHTETNFELTQQFTLNGITGTAINRANAIWEAIHYLEDRIQFHNDWAEECQKNMNKKYTKWAHIPSVFPIKPIITCGFGARRSPFGGPSLEAHNGVDLAGPIGLPVKACADGVVLLARDMSGYGNLVIIDHENGLYSYYGHCVLLEVVEGQRVKRYQEIALLGSTGRSTGPHVHFEIREEGKAVNPLNYIEAEEE
jgi:murein DD-endopeptidase MepM/ murein hydrolase activator NlpD